MRELSCRPEVRVASYLINKLQSEREAQTNRWPHKMPAKMGPSCWRPSKCLALICIISTQLIISNCQTTTTTRTSSSQNRKPLTKCDQQEGQQQINQRQQRQFNYNQLSKQQQQLPANTPLINQLNPALEHEEFSLNSPSNNFNGNYNNYTLLPASNGNISSLNETTPTATTASGQQGAQQQGEGGPNASGSSNGEQQAINTTPALPSDSISSPTLASQMPPVTTSSSISSQAKSSSQSVTFQPTSLEPTNLVADQYSQARAAQQQGARSPLSEGESSMGDLRPEQKVQQQQQQFQVQSHSQPISSSPSSISIITPLNGPPALQQQTTHTTSVSAIIGGGGGATGQASGDSQSMMKPIFVVGNPITERDYNTSPVQYQQAQLQQQQQQVSLYANYPSSSAAESNGNKQPELGPNGQAAESLLALGGHSPAAGKLAAPKSLDASAVHQQQQPPQMTGQGQHSSASPTGRSEKIPNEPAPMNQMENSTGNYSNGDRMSGPPLIYLDGQLASANSNGAPGKQADSVPAANSTSQQPQQTPLTPRLFQQAPALGGGAAIANNNPRRPSLPPAVNQANAVSGFRSPLSSGGYLTQPQPALPPTNQLLPPANGNSNNMAQANFYQTSPPYAGNSAATSMGLLNSQPGLGYNKQAFVVQQQQQQQQQLVIPTPAPTSAVTGGGSYSGRRPINITRVEHISAECSNDLIRAVIVFNGTFKGIIYSSGYVNDPTCLYVNGTGLTRYEFSIRLNQCGTLGRQELHQPTIPGEARRRDQVMWNTLSIQYNSIIEQEWDEHFRVSCEYGSDFWKTVSFSPFNVETNTGSPVVFTINPPQCQMDVLLGHGIGPKIAVDGPVTVGDPLTLLIHMKSEKAGYDILVKNCFAHNGGKQRMQLIDTNGCVVNERFISPFRGTYNDNDLRHVTLYAYLKAFRFTGSPVLYLECEIHMCQSACPPQMCYWRRLSKRSVDNSEFDYEYTTNTSNSIKHGKANGNEELSEPVMSDSLNLFKALQVRHESNPSLDKPSKAERLSSISELYGDDDASLICYGHLEIYLFLTLVLGLILLVITISIVCCLRVRKLTNDQLRQNRMLSSKCGSSSLIPSIPPSFLIILCS